MPSGYERVRSEDAKEYTTAVESSLVKSSELAAAEMARKDLVCDRKSSHLI
jgi:hypothetical protein